MFSFIKVLLHLHNILLYNYFDFQYRCISKNLNIVKKKKFLYLISESEAFIYSRFITCKVKHFKSVFVFILMIRAYSSWKSKISISKYWNISQDQSKKGFAKQKSSSSLKYVDLSTQYLVGAPLAQTPACGSAEALLSLQLGSTVSHLSLENIP